MSLSTSRRLLTSLIVRLRKIIPHEFMSINSTPIGYCIVYDRHVWLPSSILSEPMKYRVVENKYALWLGDRSSLKSRSHPRIRFLWDIMLTGEFLTFQSQISQFSEASRGDYLFQKGRTRKKLWEWKRRGQILSSEFPRLCFEYHLRQSTTVRWNSKTQFGINWDLSNEIYVPYRWIDQFIEHRKTEMQRLMISLTNIHTIDQV
jgi:hypothetical protein